MRRCPALLAVLLLLAPRAMAVPLADVRAGSEIYRTALDPLTPSLGASVLLTAAGTPWRDLAHDGAVYYGLRADGTILEHPDGIGGTESVFASISPGWVGLAHDGQSFFGLASDGSVFRNPDGLGGPQAPIGTLGASGWDGLAHDGTQFFGLFSDEAVHASPGGLDGVQTLVGTLPAGAGGIALPVVARPVARLVPATVDPGDDYGYGADISGNAVVVGAPDDGQAASRAGSAFFFRFDGSAWNEEDAVVASDATSGAGLGWAVSISGDAALLGAPGTATGAGSAYVFQRGPSGWVEQQKLLASDAQSFDRFGEAVALSGHVALVGAKDDDDAGPQSGSAYVFRFGGTTWSEEQKLTASDAQSNDRFGASVAVSGDVALVGASGGAGAAYVFRLVGSSWVEEQKLLPPPTALDNGFGGSVALSGSVALVSSVGEDHPVEDAGAVYVHRFDGTSWIQEQRLQPLDPSVDEFFGRSVGVEGDLAVVGAWWADGYFPRSGEAYAYRFDGSSWDEVARMVPSDDEFSVVFGISAGVSGQNVVVGALPPTVEDPVGVGSAHVFSFESSCGDGTVDPGEACDDGGNAPGDGCSPACEIEGCANGIDDDGDGRTDFGDDPGCSNAGDLSERSDLLPCDNGIDDDADGAADFDPATAASPGDETQLPAGVGDPVCIAPDFPRENSQCQDGIDNELDGQRDYDGGLSVLGPGHPDLGPPDAYCGGQPQQNAEAKRACGLGGEAAVLVAPLLRAWRRRARPRR